MNNSEFSSISHLSPNRFLELVISSFRVDPRIIFSISDCEKTL